MKTIDKETRKKILGNPYMTANDFYLVLPIGKNQALKMFNDVYNQLESEGVKLFRGRPRTIPTSEFKKRCL